MIWASRFAHCVRSRRAIRGSLRSYLRRCFASAWYCAASRLAATIPLAKTRTLEIIGHSRGMVVGLYWQHKSYCRFFNA